jgi:Na+(H+)/acetate symporter ActP
MTDPQHAAGTEGRAPLSPGKSGMLSGSAFDAATRLSPFLKTRGFASLPHGRFALIVTRFYTTNRVTETAKGQKPIS